MASVVRRIGWSFTAILAGAVLFRAVFVASRTDGGWALVRNQLIASMPPAMHSFNESRESVTARKIRWLMAAADEVAADPKSTAADCMGAALVLQSEWSSFWRDELEDLQEIGRIVWNRSRSPAPSAINEEEAAVRSLLGESLCKMRQLAAKATALEPDRKDWWRLRALMAGGTHNKHFAELADSLAFAVGVAHDPDNALYEYLLGCDCFDGAFREQPSEDGDQIIGEQIILSDVDLFEQARQHYALAYAKPLLAMGEASSGCAAQFLGRVHGPLAFKLLCASPDAIRNMHSGLLNSIHLPLADWWIEEHRFTELREVMIYSWFLLRNPDLHWRKQWEASGELGRLEAMANFGCQAQTAAEREYMMARQSCLIVARGSQYQDLRWSTTCSVVSIVAAAFGWLFLIVALVTALLTAILGNRQCGVVTPSARWSAWLPLLLWIIAFAVTFSTLGLLLSFQPTMYVIPQSVVWATIAVIGILLAAFVWFTGRFVLKQGRLPRGNRSGFYNPARLSLIVIGVVVFLFPLICGADQKARSAIIAGWNQFPRNFLYQFRHDNNLGVGHENPVDALLQWGFHGGLFWTAGIWLAISLLVAWWNSRRSIDPRTSLAQLNNWRLRWSGCMRQICKSALVLTLLMAIIWSVAIASWIEGLQAQYDKQLAKLADPAWFVKLVESEAQQFILPADSQSNNPADTSPD